jgi:hypothetical protein
MRDEITTGDPAAEEAQCDGRGCPSMAEAGKPASLGVFGLVFHRASPSFHVLVKNLPAVS